jgi:hypothetical protein
LLGLETSLQDCDCDAEGPKFGKFDTPSQIWLGVGFELSSFGSSIMVSSFSDSFSESLEHDIKRAKNKMSPFLPIN